MNSKAFAAAVACVSEISTSTEERSRGVGGSLHQDEGSAMTIRSKGKLWFMAERESYLYTKLPSAFQDCMQQSES